MVVAALRVSLVGESTLLEITKTLGRNYTYESTILDVCSRNKKAINLNKIELFFLIKNKISRLRVMFPIRKLK